LGLENNQLTSFDGTGLSSLTILDLQVNQLTSFDGTELSGLTELYLNSNPLTTPQVNDSILDTLELYGLENGFFSTSNGRTAASTSDYNTLIGRGWTIEGANLISTSRRVGVRRKNP
jgi:Leucine-rich repeat (LRR) protein